MPNGNKPPKERQHEGKAQTSSGISQDVSQLRSRMDQVEKTLQESSPEKNQWNTEAKNWIGKNVYIAMVSGVTLLGELRWIDRYTMCLRASAPDTDLHKKIIVVHKGAIAFMYQEGEAA